MNLTGFANGVKVTKERNENDSSFGPEHLGEQRSWILIHLWKNGGYNQVSGGREGQEFCLAPVQLAMTFRHLSGNVG